MQCTTWTADSLGIRDEGRRAVRVQRDESTMKPFADATFGGADAGSAARVTEIVVLDGLMD